MRTRLISLVLGLVAVAVLGRRFMPPPGTTWSHRATVAADAPLSLVKSEAPRNVEVNFVPETAPAMTPAAAGAPAFTPDASPQPQAPPVVQRQIRSAQLEILVDSVSHAFHFADSITARLGAVIADAQQSQDLHAVHDGRWSIRVPATQFDALLAQLRHLGNVKSEAISTQDITRQYADLETRLVVKQETVDRLRGLLASRTAKLADVLQVERELARAITELEQMKGERRMDDDLVAMSTVSVHVFEREPAPTTIASGLGAMLRASFDTFAGSVSSLLNLAMFLLPWTAVAYCVWFVARRRVRVPNAM